MIEFKLTKVIITNFTCYYGDNIIDFTTNSKNNIFLFNMNNGYGKTSLFHAIKWAFYGENVDYYKDSDKVTVDSFLSDKLDPSQGSFSVEVFFKYCGRSYELKRTYKPSSRKKSYIVLVKNGREITSEDDMQDELDKIMPINFADFFMFDGEQLSKFTTAQRGLNYKDSLHQLLGLKQIEVLKEDLEHIERRYNAQLLQQSSTNTLVEQEKKRIANIQREIDNHKIKIEQYQKNITKNEEQREMLAEKRNLFQNLPKVMEELTKLTEKQNNLIRDISSVNTLLEQNSINLFINFVKKDLEKLIRDNKERLEELKDICGITDEQAVRLEERQKIIKKSIPSCDVCGHKLTSEETKNVKEEVQKIKANLKVFEENRQERNELISENALFNTFKDLSEQFDFQDNIDRMQEKIIKLKDIEKHITDKTKESSRKEYGKLGELNGEISALESENTTMNNQIKLLLQQIKGLKDKQDEATREIKRLGHDDKLIQKTTSMIAYLADITKKLEQTLEAGVNSKRELILKESNNLFKQITNKPEEYERIIFEGEDSYAFKIIRKDGKQVINPSKGEKQVMAMSFLLGLSQFTGRDNVIMMDTPVASLDEEHSSGIGKALAGLNNQVIFLAQPKELKGEIYKNMKPRIAKEFEVERVDYKSRFKEVKQ